jgi:ribosomal protein S18 acetylase RimI-like enzyme
MQPDGKSMQILRAVEADLGAMLDLLQAVVAPGDTLPYPETTDEDDFRAQWFGGGQTPWVAVVDSRICGLYTMGANHSGRGSHVASATYAVSPWAQGRGIGRALVQHSLEQAKEAGYLAMQFNYIVSINRVAIALYKKLGFTIVGTLPKAFRHETLGLVDAHVMYRFL